MDAQAALAAFDRQNHAGASDALAASLREGDCLAQHYCWHTGHKLRAFVTTRASIKISSSPPETLRLCCTRVSHSATKSAGYTAIKEGAEELLAEKRVVSGAVNIRTNREKMKVRPSLE